MLSLRDFSKFRSRAANALAESRVASFVRVTSDAISENIAGLKETREREDVFVPLIKNSSGSVSANSGMYSRLNKSAASVSPSVSSCSTGWSSHSTSSVDTFEGFIKKTDAAIVQTRKQTKRKMRITDLWSKYGNNKKKQSSVDAAALKEKLAELAEQSKENNVEKKVIPYVNTSHSSSQHSFTLIAESPQSRASVLNDDFALIPAPKIKKSPKKVEPVKIKNIQAEAFQKSADYLTEVMRPRNVLRDGLFAFWSRRLGMPTLPGLTLAVADSESLAEGSKMLGHELLFPRKSKLATQYFSLVKEHENKTYPVEIKATIQHVQDRTAESLQASRPNDGLEEEIRTKLTRLAFLYSFQPAAIKFDFNSKAMAKLRRLRHKYASKDREPIRTIHSGILKNKSKQRYAIVGPPGVGKTTAVQRSYKYADSTSSLIEAGNLRSWEGLVGWNTQNPHALQDLGNAIPMYTMGIFQTAAHFAREGSAIILDEAAKLANEQAENASIMAHSDSVPSGLGYSIPIDKLDIYLNGNTSLNGGKEGSGLRRRWLELEFQPLAKEKRQQAMKKPLYEAIKTALAKNLILNKDSFDLILQKFEVHQAFILDNDPTQGAPYARKVASEWPEIVLDTKGDDEKIKEKILSIATSFKEKGNY